MCVDSDDDDLEFEDASKEEMDDYNYTGLQRFLVSNQGSKY